MKQFARVGILGGMGPAATADFYAKLVRATPAERDQDHIPVIVEAHPSVPDRTVLATAATAEGQLYPRRAAADARTRGWSWVLPSREEQARLEDGIAAVKAGDVARGSALIGTLMTALSGKVDAVVYACTEVPIAMDGSAAPVLAIDSTAALAALASRASRGLARRKAN